MRALLMALITFTLCDVLALDPAQPVALVLSGEVVLSRDELPKKYHDVTPYWSASHRWESDGWVQWVKGTPCPAGQIVTNSTWVITSEEAIESVECGPRPAAEPFDFPDGIAIPASTNSDLYYKIEVTDSGELFAVLAHASPYDHEAFMQRKAAKLAEMNTKNQRQKAEAENFGKGQLQSRVEAIEAWIRAEEGIEEPAVQGR